MMLLLPASIFITVMLTLALVFSYVRYCRERRSLVEKIKQDGIRQRTRELTLVRGPNAVFTWIKQYLVRIMSRLGNFVKPKSEGELSSMQKNLLRAGYRSRNAAIIFFGAKGFFAILLPSACLFVQLILPRPVEHKFLAFILLLMAVAGFYLPHIWLRAHTDRRKEKICEGFPDSLDLLVVCVEAGMGLDAAINRVAEEMRLVNQEISDELQVLNLELRAGKSRIDALRSLAFRTDLEDVKSLVTLLIQAERFGTSIAQALRIHSDAMRVKRQQRAEEMAGKLPVKILFPLIFFIFPSLLIVILGPPVIKIIDKLPQLLRR
ncbi:MAG: type II secretion system F family protein [bacterium]